ncbi:hypothetical protein D9M73_228200 [compost metagenome]
MLGNRRKQFFHIDSGLHRRMIEPVRHCLGRVERPLGMSHLAPAEMVDKLVACDRVQPRREGLGGIIGISSGVHRQ